MSAARLDLLPTTMLMLDGQRVAHTRRRAQGRRGQPRYQRIAPGLEPGAGTSPRVDAARAGWSREEAAASAMRGRAGSGRQAPWQRRRRSVNGH